MCIAGMTKVTRARSEPKPQSSPVRVPPKGSNALTQTLGKGPAKNGVTAALSKSTFDATTTTPVTSHGVKLIDNQQYLPELMSLLDGAKTSIDLIQYNFFSESGDAKSIVDKLIAKKQANPKLAIRLFIEGDHGTGAARNLLTVAKLKAAGIDVVLDSKNLITHAKAVSVDGKHVLAGSHNMTNTSMDKNNEVSLSITSTPLAKAYTTYFNQLVADPSHLHPTTTKSGNVTMLTDTAYEDQLLDVISKATTSLDASMYDFNFDGKDPKAKEVMDALVAAAAKGVKVNIWLEQNSDASVDPEITKNNEAAAAYLRAHGVTVNLDDPTQISHQKFIIRDQQELLMGSTNWTENDFNERHQINWRVADPKLAQSLVGILKNEIATESKPPVTLS